MEGLQLVEVFLEVGGALDVGEDHVVDIHGLLVTIQRKSILQLLFCITYLPSGRHFEALRAFELGLKLWSKVKIQM